MSVPTPADAAVAIDPKEIARLRAASRARRWRDAWTLFKRNPITMFGAGIVLALVLIAIFAPVLATHDPYAQELVNRLQPASAAHWFGTDNFGRDIYSRVVHGARLTLMIAVVVAVISGPIGLAIGVLSGYLGGWLDEVLMRIADIFLAFPKLILAIAFAAAMGPGIFSAIIAISIANWPNYARLVRAEVLSVRDSDYIDAVRALGASRFAIMWRHITPMTLSTLIVRVSLDMGTIILTAAGLGFLGLGAQPPQPEWGLMVSDGRNYLQDQWWISTLPGVAILLVVLGFNLLGDGLRDVLDPRGRR